MAGTESRDTGSWTPCIREARGRYVYIATSDDTMPPDCLGTLVAALDTHPDCDLAHCPLRAVDENGRDIPALGNSWSHGSMFGQSSGPLVSTMHVRLAPFDGLLHLLGGSVYTSITQLLIRRSLFERIGCFQAMWGSVGDFNWTMRAGLVANTVHVPDTWGGGRGALDSGDGGRRDGVSTARAQDRGDDRGCARGLLGAPGACRARRQLTTRWLTDSRELRAFTLETARRAAPACRPARRPHRATHVCGLARRPGVRAVASAST